MVITGIDSGTEILMIAKSVAGSCAIRLARTVRLSARVTLITATPSTTW